MWLAGLTTASHPWSLESSELLGKSLKSGVLTVSRTRRELVMMMPVRESLSQVPLRMLMLIHLQRLTLTPRELRELLLRH